MSRLKHLQGAASKDRHGLERPLDVSKLHDELAGRRKNALSTILLTDGRNASPLVSVCISSYNHANYLGEAIESVLSQTYENIEILIVDDASTDGSVEIIEEYSSQYPEKIKPIYLALNEGPARAPNRAFQAAQGEYIAFLGSDDRMLPDRIQKQVAFLNSNPTFVAVFTDVFIIGSDGARSREVNGNELLFNQPFGNLRRQLITGNFINAPSAMVRRADLMALGGYSPLLRYVQDYELWGRLLQRGDLAKLPERLTEYRIHNANLSIFGSDGPRFALTTELVSVIVQFTRLWSLESLLDQSIASPGDRASALLELAGVMELVDYHYFGKPALACARAYELVLEASRIDAESSLPVKQHLEGCLEHGFKGKNMPFAGLAGRKILWFADQRAALSRGKPELSIDIEETVPGWLKARDFLPSQKAAIDDFLGRRGGPSIAVFLKDFDGDSGRISSSLDSVFRAKSLYAKIEPVVLTTDASFDREGVLCLGINDTNVPRVLNAFLRSHEIDWFVILDCGEEVNPNSLLAAVVDLSANPECRAVYADEMGRQEGGELAAILRPDLNLDYLLSLPASMAHHWLFRRDVWLELGCFAEQYHQAFELEYILRLIERDGFNGLAHISEPLFIANIPTLRDVPQEREVITRHLAARGYFQAAVASRLPGRYDIDYGHPLQPKVSILILVKGSLALIHRCMESLLSKTAYSNFEVLLLDQGNSRPEIRNWLSGLEKMGVKGLKVLRFEADSKHVAIQNQAALQADGEYLLWLGDGAGIFAEDWLKQLVNHAQRPEVGAVGCKLISGDGLIRHAGMVLGLGGPVGRAFLGHDADDPGYMQRLQVDQNYSAVSSLCMMVRRSLFLEMGGFVEDPLMSRWVDADLCLRLQQQGYLTVWTPRAQLLMDEPPLDAATAEEEDAMYARWLPVLARDPAYNPNFALHCPLTSGFKLASAKFSWKPLASLGTVPTVLAHNADSAGCGYYRVIQPHNALKEAGLIDGVVSGHHLAITELERFNPDSIILQRQISEAQYERMRRMKVFSRALKVFELDDYLPNLPLKSIHRATMPKDIVKSLRRALACVDRFVVSTQPLAEAFAQLHGEIQVVENRLDPRWWKNLSSERRVSCKPRVGWAGGSSHTGDLEMIADVVKELAGEVEWVFFGMCPSKLRPYVHEVHSGVAIERYPEALARLNLDLAIAPVEHNLFNECKSNLRLLEYGACGFPVVCSDLVCYRGELPVTRVRNRFKDWVDAIRMHLADLDATARQGDALRAAVHKDWMLEGANLERWREAWLP